MKEWVCGLCRQECLDVTEQLNRSMARAAAGRNRVLGKDSAPPPRDFARDKGLLLLRKLWKMQSVPRKSIPLSVEWPEFGVRRGNPDIVA